MTTRRNRSRGYLWPLASLSLALLREISRESTANPRISLAALEGQLRESVIYRLEFLPLIEKVGYYGIVTNELPFPFSRELREGDGKLFQATTGATAKGRRRWFLHAFETLNISVGFPPGHAVRIPRETSGQKA